jgi:hypothetical protein
MIFPRLCPCDRSHEAFVRRRCRAPLPARTYLEARQRVKRDPPTGAPPQVDSPTGSYSVLHSTTMQARVTRGMQTPGVRRLRRLRQQASPVQVSHSRPPCNNDEATTTPMVWPVVPKLSVACPGDVVSAQHTRIFRARTWAVCLQ